MRPTDDVTAAVAQRGFGVLHPLSSQRVRRTHSFPIPSVTKGRRRPDPPATGDKQQQSKQPVAYFQAALGPNPDEASDNECTAADEGKVLLPPPNRERSMIVNTVVVEQPARAAPINIRYCEKRNSFKDEDDDTTEEDEDYDDFDDDDTDAGVYAAVDAAALTDKYPTFSKPTQPRRESASQSSNSCYSTDEFMTDDDDSAEYPLAGVDHCEQGGFVSQPDPPSASSASNDIRFRKQVRFRFDAQGSVACTYSLKPIPLTETDVRNFWWSGKELEEIRYKARKVRKHIIRNSPDYIHATYHLLCLLGGIQQRTDLPRGRWRAQGTAKSSSSTTSKRSMTDMEALVILMTRDARGFEKALLLQMDIPYPTHHYSVHDLIQTQAKLRQEASAEHQGHDGTDPLPHARMEQLLARQYHNDTQVAVAWARLLADGDVMALCTTQVSL